MTAGLVPNSPGPATSRVWAVVVTLNPDTEALDLLLSTLDRQVEHVAVVDNGSSNASVVARLCERPSRSFIGLPANAGIATAQNVGIGEALRLRYDFVLLMDQDSVPADGMVHALLRAFTPDGSKAGGSGDRPVAAAGPVATESRESATVSEALVYSFTKWGPKRRSIPEAGDELDVPFVLASGCLISVEALRAVGPMNSSLFIDHVDLAWCMRAWADGYRVVVVGDAFLEHSLGEELVKLPGRTQRVHSQTPFRNYYMVRNTLWLLRAPFLTWRWKLGFASYLAKYVGFYTLVTQGRRERIPRIVTGLVDGVRGSSTGRPPAD